MASQVRSSVNWELRYTEREEGMEKNDVCAAPSCQGVTSSLNSTLVVRPDGGLKKQTETCCLYNAIVSI
jgi:hypothetical protein